MIQNRRFFVVAIIVTVMSALFVGAASAQCSPDGTPGDDNITCNSPDDDGIDAGEGNNTITVNAPVNGNIEAGSGNDTVTTDAPVNGNIQAGDGDNTITTDAPVNGNIETGDGNDIVTTGAPVNGNIQTGGGNDIVTTGAPVNGNIQTGDGNDIITTNAPVNGNIEAGAGNDTVEVNAPVNGTIDGNAGTDIIIFSGETCDETHFLGRDRPTYENFETVENRLQRSVSCKQPEPSFRLTGEIEVIIDGVSNPSVPVRLVCDVATSSVVFLEITGNGRGRPAFSIPRGRLNSAIAEARAIADDDNDDDDDDDDDNDNDVEVVVLVHNGISVIASPDVIVVVAPDVNSGQLVYIPFNHNVSCNFED